MLELLGGGRDPPGTGCETSRPPKQMGANAPPRKVLNEDVFWPQRRFYFATCTPGVECGRDVGRLPSGVALAPESYDSFCFVAVAFPLRWSLCRGFCCGVLVSGASVLPLSLRPPLLLSLLLLHEVGGL